MKLISRYSSINRIYWILLVGLMGVLVQSCTKEKIAAIPTNIGTVRFDANTYTIENNATSPLTITLPLSLPLEKDATVLVSIDTSSTLDPTQYTISPAIPAAGLSIALPKGSTAVTFTVNSQNNFEGIKTLVLKLTMPTGGVSVSNTNAMATVTIKGSPIIYPELQTSVAILSLGNTISGTNSPSQSYTLKGVKLKTNVTVTASDNFQVSLDNTTFSKTLTIPFATADAGPVTIYAQFNALTGINQPVTGTITHSSGTVPDNTINVSAIEYGVALPGVLLMNDNFSYGAVASTLDAVAGSVWPVFAVQSGQQIAYLPNGLTFAGYAGSNIGGAVVSVNGAGSRPDYSHTFPGVASGVVYAAQMINVSAGATAGDFFCGLRDPNGNYFNRLYVKDDGSGKPTFSIGKNSSTVATATGTYNYGTTYLVITKYDFNSGISTLYVLSSAPTKYEPAVPNATTSVGSGPASLVNTFIRQNTGVLTATYDGVRIATSWKDAVGL